MTMSRRQPRAEFKATVALEAIRGERTIHEVAAASGGHPVQITPGKKWALDELPKMVSSRRGTTPQEDEALQAVLSQQIGQFKVALDWVKQQVGHVC